MPPEIVKHRILPNETLGRIFLYLLGVFIVVASHYLLFCLELSHKTLQLPRNWLFFEKTKMVGNLNHGLFDIRLKANEFHLLLNHSL